MGDELEMQEAGRFKIVKLFFKFLDTNIQNLKHNMHFCNLKALSGVTKTATILTISTRLRSHATVAMEIGRELAIGN